jgi:hypothetical protein
MLKLVLAALAAVLAPGVFATNSLSLRGASSSGSPCDSQDVRSLPESSNLADQQCRVHTELFNMMEQHNNMVGTPNYHWAKFIAEHKNQRIHESAIRCAVTEATFSHDHTRVVALGSRAASLFARMEAIEALGPQGVGALGGRSGGGHAALSKRAAEDIAAQLACGGDIDRLVGISRPTSFGRRT